MRRIALLLACLSASATAAPNPVTQPSKLDPAWQAKTRAFFEQAIEIPTVVGRGQVPKMAQLVADQLKAGGFAGNDIRIIPYEGLPGDKTAALVFRWRADGPTRKPILILGHMDVVEAKREDWKLDPFKLAERDGYFYGRGTADMKSGIVAATMSLIKLKASGFKPRRDIILFFTGDEETMQNGAKYGAHDWRKLTDAEFGLNADTGAGSYARDGRPLGFGISTAEKTYQTYFFTARNPGGHSSRPRADNAIYDLADALKRLQAYRFTPMLNDTTRGYFTERASQEKGALGDAMRRWLANEQDGQAADIIEASETDVGRTRTRCVATMLAAGHADNALPQSARATVNCRIMPGIDPKSVEAELKQVAGPKIEVIPDPSFIGTSTPVSPMRPDVFKAVTAAVQTLHGPAMHVFPVMQTGASDGSFFRAVGIPVYDVDGGWGISPDDDRWHGLDERIPVRAMFDDVLHWEIILQALAGK